MVPKKVPAARKEAISNYLLTAYEGRGADPFFIGVDPLLTTNSPTFAASRIVLAETCQRECKKCRSEVSLDGGGALIVRGDRPRAPKGCELKGKHLWVRMNIDVLVS